MHSVLTCEITDNYFMLMELMDLWAMFPKFQVIIVLEIN